LQSSLLSTWLPLDQHLDGNHLPPLKISKHICHGVCGPERRIELAVAGGGVAARSGGRRQQLTATAGDGSGSGGES